MRGDYAHDQPDTRSREYAQRLKDLEGVWWKRLLDVQRPYRWNLRRHDLGATLDVGCGIGRNLVALPEGSLGVDHNERSVATARARGLDAVTPEEFEQRASGGAVFDSMLMAHVLEHLSEDAANDLIGTYLRYVRPGGTVLWICPQERGYATDPTHVRFVDRGALLRHAATHGLHVVRTFSFPLPTAAGRVFPYNEFVLVARRP